MKTFHLQPLRTGKKLSFHLLLWYFLLSCMGLSAQPEILGSVSYKQISHFETNQTITAMKLSRDGTRIIFATGGPMVKVFTIDSDGSDLTEVYDFQRTGTGPFVDINATGDRIIWCDGHGEIFSSNYDGSNLEELATLLPNPDPSFADLEPVIPVPPRITEDGTQVFFLNMDRDSRVSGAWKVNTDGSNLIQIFNYLKVAEDVFGTDGSEYNYNVAFTDGFDISGDGSRMIFGTRIFKLAEGDLDRGHAIVADGTTFYPAGEYALGHQPFATNLEGNRFVMYRREFNEDLGHDEINVYYVPVGTGDPVKVIGGLDIFGISAHTQLTADGSQAITFAGNGRLPITLLDRISGSRWDLVTIDMVSIAMGGYRFSESRLPSINDNGDRFCFLSTSVPPQIWMASINSDAITSQPSISEILFDPDFVRIDHSNLATISAHVTHLEDTIHTVSFEGFREGAYQFRAVTGDYPGGYLWDNGNFGDPSANDGYYYNNTISIDLPETPLGAYAIRIAAVEASLQEVTMVDASPFNIVGPDTSSTGIPVFMAPMLEVFQNYPNPAVSLTTILYKVGDPSFVDMELYDTGGRKVSTLCRNWHSPGSYTQELDVSALQAGIYFCRFRAGNASGFMKIMVR